MKPISPAASLLFGNRLALAQLVAMYLTEPVYVTTARDNIIATTLDPTNAFGPGTGGTSTSKTFIGGRQTAIDSIKDQGGEIAGLTFQLSGVPNEVLGIALAEPIQGKAVRVFTCIMDPDSQAIVDVQPAWAGTLDQMPISQGVDSSVITVTAEHRGITFARAKGLRYTDGDQQMLFPHDRCLEFLVAQSTHQDVWPAAAFFRQ
jgi:hypothetical protein